MTNKKHKQSCGRVEYPNQIVRQSFKDRYHSEIELFKYLVIGISMMVGGLYWMSTLLCK